MGSNLRPFLKSLISTLPSTPLSLESTLPSTPLSHESCCTCSTSCGFLSWESTLGGCFYGVGCASEDTPDVFGVSSPRELKAKPPIIRSTPWLLCDFLRVLRVRSRPSSLSLMSARQILRISSSVKPVVRRKRKKCMFKHILEHLFRTKIIAVSGTNATRNESAPCLFSRARAIRTHASRAKKLYRATLTRRSMGNPKSKNEPPSPFPPPPSQSFFVPILNKDLIGS